MIHLLGLFLIVFTLKMALVGSPLMETIFATLTTERQDIHAFPQNNTRFPAQLSR
jgi:hypothetical protein